MLLYRRRRESFELGIDSSCSAPECEDDYYKWNINEFGFCEPHWKSMIYHIRDALGLKK